MLVDSNILVRLRDKNSPHYWTCYRVVSLLADRGDPLYLGAQALIEFWSVATRPLGNNGLGRSVEQADSDCQLFLEMMTLLPEPADIAERWLELVRRYGVQGKAVHDARLVAFALAHGVSRILTLNPDDFRRYPEVTPVTPSQLLEQLGD